MTITSLTGRQQDDMMVKLVDVLLVGLMLEDA